MGFRSSGGRGRGQLGAACDGLSLGRARGAGGVGRWSLRGAPQAAADLPSGRRGASRGSGPQMVPSPTNRGGGSKSFGSASRVGGLLLAELPEDLKRLRAEVLAGLEFETDDDEAEESSRGVPPALVASAAPKEVDFVTAELALESSGEKRLEDITQLLLRDRGFAALGRSPNDASELFDQLCGLEVLSLSRNRLADIEPLALLDTLIEVNVNFNELQDISPLFKCQQLEKLFAANNLISSIDGLEACKRLRVLSLFANRLGAGYDVVAVLKPLQFLRSLDIGRNDCCSSPSQKYALLQALGLLELLDGQHITASDRQRGAEFLTEVAQQAAVASPHQRHIKGSSDPLSFTDAEVSEEASPHARPGTAPAAFATGCFGGSFRPATGAVTAAVPTAGYPPTAPLAAGRSMARPPLPPTSNQSAQQDTLFQGATTLPGQKLRSARANRIDEVLAREPSPEASSEGGRILTPTLDARDPKDALQSLIIHSEAIMRRLDVVRADRDNLQFQVAHLQKEQHASEPEQLRQQIELLEAENMNQQAVESESEQLQARLAALEADVAALAIAPPSPARGHELEVEDQDDIVGELRFENRLLQKRFLRLAKYTEDLQQAMLENLRIEVRDTATALARCNQGSLQMQPSKGTLGRRLDGADVENVIDCLTIGDGKPDVEWHRKA